MEIVAQNIDEKFSFSPKLKKQVFIIGIVGIILSIIGILVMNFGGHHGHEAGHVAEHAMAEHHGSADWVKRLFANLWINNLFFTGLSIIGVFFFAVQYVANAGWSVILLRVISSFGRFLPIAGVLMLVVFFFASHDLFHWTHDYLYDEAHPEYDPIIAGKAPFLNTPFYLTRMIAFFTVWSIFAFVLRKNALSEDANGGTKYYRRLVRISVGFLIFFGVSSSISAWDWIMSIDTHWFSTMFGWYVFASWFVSGLAGITLLVVLLKDWGYLKPVTENHLHDLGKFVFAFSIFWTYIWFSQFLLIYYANIPEETVYFWERLKSDYYSKFIFVNLFLNFFFPFLGLMTRDAKRKITFLKIVCVVVLIGHWLDFYLMVTPGTLKELGGLGFLEIGLPMVYLSAFAYVVLSGLSKVALIPKNHPMLEESLYHHT